jgi:hypothetical protein
MCLAWASPAGAAAPVSLVVVDCPQPEQVREIFYIELSTLNADTTRDARKVVVSCASDTANIQIYDARNRQTGSRDLPLHRAQQETHARLLALAASELLADSGSVTPEQVVEPEPEAAPATVGSPPPRRVGVFAKAAGLSVGTPRGMLWGGGLGLEYEWSENYATSIEFSGASGSVPTELAKVTELGAHAAVSSHVGATLGDLRLGIGPGVLLGWFKLSADPIVPRAEGGDVDGVWGGVHMSGRARLSIGARLYVRVDAQAGLVTLPLRGVTDGGQSVVDIDGAWLAGGLGAGLSF